MGKTKETLKDIKWDMRRMAQQIEELSYSFRAIQGCAVRENKDEPGIGDLSTVAQPETMMKMMVRIDNQLRSYYANLLDMELAVENSESYLDIVNQKLDLIMGHLGIQYSGDDNIDSDQGSSEEDSAGSDSGDSGTDTDMDGCNRSVNNDNTDVAINSDPAGLEKNDEAATVELQ